MTTEADDIEMTAEPSTPVPTSRADEIREIAARLFYHHGYNAVGMRMIAEAAGVRPASLYHHFASKEELLYDIVLEVTKNFIDDHLPLLQMTDDPPARLARLVELHIEYFWRHRDATSVGLREIRNLSDEHYTEIRNARLRYQHGIQQFIADGVAMGHFRCEDPQLVGLALLDVMNGVNGWFSEGGRHTIQSLSHSYSRLVVQHLLGAETGPSLADRHDPTNNLEGCDPAEEA
jgi:AcrR family transcriptional regulator